MGILLGMVFVLTTLEYLFAVPFLPPHAKPGFANIIVMYCVFFVGRRDAFILNGLKSLFVFITRGAVAGLLSLGGGLLSIGVIILLASIKRKPPGYAIISVSGGVCHNLGQFVIIMFLFGSPVLVYYIPVLVLSGIAAGLVTGFLLKVLIPVLSKIKGS
jgi:heptaprenyl diphosphate synthase